MKKLFLFLVTIMLSMIARAYDFEIDGYRYTVITSSTAEFAGVNPDYKKEVIIPEYVSYSGKQLSVNTIGERAFENYETLFLRIPQHITLIKNAAFYHAHIDSLHFEDSDNSISLQNTINRGPSLAYSTLGSVYMGRQISRTDYNSNADGPFYCSAIKKVYIGKTCSLGQELFQNTSLEKVIINDGSYISSISSECFRNCSQLKTIDLKEGLVSIGSLAFYNCTSLDSIFIPSTVRTISANAFSEAKNIKKVVSASDAPVAISETAFPGIVYLSATLYVPSGSKSKYIATQGWKEFVNIVEMGGVKKCATPSISYGGKKLMFVCDTEDVEFVTEIKVADNGKFFDDRITLTATYEISVYATKAGYENSDKATATLVWANATFTDTTPEPTAISPATEMAPVPVLIQSNGGIVTVQGAADGTPVSIYTTAGTLAGSAVSQNGRAAINTNLTSGSIAIIKIGTQSYKVAIK